MRKNFFIQTHLKEIALMVFATYLTVCMIAGADEQTVNGSVYPVNGLIISPALFSFVAMACGCYAKTVDEAKRLKLTTVLCAIVSGILLIGCSCYLQQKFSVDDLLKVGCGVVLCAIICGMFYDMQIVNIEKLEDLRKNHPDEYLREMIRSKRVLSEKQLLELLYFPDAEVLLLHYMEYEDLPVAIEIKVAEAPYFVRLLERLPAYYYSQEAVSHMFDQPNAPELILLVVGNGYVFDLRNELKMFKLPNASQVVKLYIRNHQLSDTADKCLFDLTDAEELVKEYDELYEMSTLARSMAEERGWLSK